MATEVALKVTADGSQAEGSVKSIKTQLKEAQAEVIKMSEKFGATSREAALAAQKAGQLKDKIGDAKALTDAFTPDKKFQAFAGSIQGVVGGFQALQGAQALFGAQSEEVQQIMMKLQAAMAISQGLSSINASIDSFKNLGSVIKNATIFQKGYQVATVAAAAVQKLFTGAVASTSVGFKALRAAIISTGIGALIVGVTMLISKIADWVGGTEEAEAAQKQFNKSIERQNELIEESLSALNFERQAFERRAKIQGLSQDQILKQQVDFNKKEVALLANDLKTKLDLRKKAFYDENIDAEAFNKIKEETNKSQQALQDAINKTKLSELDIEANAAEEQRNIAKKRNEDSKRAHDKRLSDSKAAADKSKQQRQQEQQEIEAANKAAAAATKQLQDEIFLQQIKDEDERAKARLKQEYDNAVKEINQSKASSKEKQKQLKALKEKFDLDEAALDAQIKEKKAKDDLDFEKELNAIIFKTRIDSIKNQNEKEREELINNYKAQYDEIDANEKYNAEKKLQLKAALKIKEDQELSILDEKYKQKQLTDEAALDLQRANDQDLSFQERLQAIKEREDAVNSIVFESDAARTEYEKQNAEARKKIAEEEKNAKLAAADETANSLSQLSQLIGEQTGVGKAMAVAAASISTTSAAIKAYERGVEVPFVGMALGPINAAIAVAAGISNIKKILAVKVPNEKGAPPLPSNTQISAPLTPQIGTTTLNQTQVNQMASATARAFVLESDVSGSQERIRRINRAARIN